MSGNGPRSDVLCVGSRQDVLRSWIDNEQRTLDMLRGRLRSIKPSRERDRLSAELQERVDALNEAREELK